MGLLPWFVSGVGLGWANSYNKDEKEDNPIYYGPIEFRDYIDRPSWFNPISGTNVDSYFIGGVILVFLFILKK